MYICIQVREGGNRGVLKQRVGWFGDKGVTGSHAEEFLRIFDHFERALISIRCNNT